MTAVASAPHQQRLVQVPPRPAALATWAPVFAEIAAGAVERENAGTGTREQVEQLLRAGFGSLHVPVALGGSGLSYRELFRLVVALGAADANVAHIFRNHFAFLDALLREEDPGARHWIDRAVAGDLFANGVTDDVRPRDEDGRADFSRFTTSLTRDPENPEVRILNGRKNYATGSLYADWMAVQANPDDGGPALTVVVPTGDPAVDVVDDWTGFGQRFTASGTVVFSQVKVTDPRQLRPRGNQSLGGSYGSALAQLFLTAVIAGTVQGSLDDAVALITTRTQNLYFAPTVDPREDLLLLHSLGELAARAFAAEASVLRAAEDIDVAAALPAAERDDARHTMALSAARAKVVVDRLGTEAGAMLFDLGGASATHRAKQLDRHWRNARTIASHNPASYKAAAVGAFLARGERLPALGFF